MRPLEAIRANCIECSGGSLSEVKNCTIPKCPMYPFRMGKDTTRKPRNLTPEQRQAIGVALHSKAKQNT